MQQKIIYTYTYIFIVFLFSTISLLSFSERKRKQNNNAQHAKQKSVKNNNNRWPHRRSRLLDNPESSRTWKDLKVTPENIGIESLLRANRDGGNLTSKNHLLGNCDSDIINLFQEL